MGAFEKGINFYYSFTYGVVYQSDETIVISGQSEFFFLFRTKISERESFYVYS